MPPVYPRPLVAVVFSAMASGVGATGVGGATTSISPGINPGGAVPGSGAGGGGISPDGIMAGITADITADISSIIIGIVAASHSGRCWGAPSGPGTTVKHPRWAAGAFWQWRMKIGFATEATCAGSIPGGMLPPQAAIMLPQVVSQARSHSDGPFLRKKSHQAATPAPPSRSQCFVSIVSRPSSR